MPAIIHSKGISVLTVAGTAWVALSRLARSSTVRARHGRVVADRKLTNWGAATRSIAPGMASMSLLFYRRRRWAGRARAGRHRARGEDVIEQPEGVDVKHDALVRPTSQDWKRSALRTTGCTIE